MNLDSDPHDMNYENVVKGLRGSPRHQVALPATGGEQSTKTPKTKGPKRAATASPAQPAVPGPLEATQPVKPKIACALHAAGSCKYGQKFRNHHVGEPGSEAARKSFAEHQKSKGQGSETSKGAGKQAGKGKDKGDGKGKKGNNKDGKTSSAVPSAAASAAASTVTITEVGGAKVMEAWKGFCAFCAKAVPSMSTFWKLSAPILATLISFIIDSPSFDCVTAASALHYIHALNNSRPCLLNYLETQTLPIT